MSVWTPLNTLIVIAALAGLIGVVGAVAVAVIAAWRGNYDVATKILAAMEQLAQRAADVASTRTATKIAQLSQASKQQEKQCDPPRVQT